MLHPLQNGDPGGIEHRGVDDEKVILNTPGKLIPRYFGIRVCNTGIEPAACYALQKIIVNCLNSLLLLPCMIENV